MYIYKKKPDMGKDRETNYEYVNHPSHYNRYSVEVLEMMARIYGYEKVITFCELNAFKYRMRMGTKPGESIEKDLEKEKFYLAEKEKYKSLQKEHLEKKYNSDNF